jgi:hypothetical protein
MRQAHITYYGEPKQAVMAARNVQHRKGNKKVNLKQLKNEDL